MPPRAPAPPAGLVPLYGHAALQTQLRDAVARGALPASLLFHGPRGIGKQRLALWLGQLILCENAERAPCGACKQCRFTARLTHPDLHWYFPRPRPKDSDPSADEINADLGEVIAERVEASGLYPTPGGDEAIFVATVRAIVHSAILSPALARRKVYVVGDAERMVPQAGAEQAANAFLKLLEEPPADTFIILTSSESGALLPTIKSRVVSLRVAPLLPAEVRTFLKDPAVAALVAREHGDLKESDLLALAGGAPGKLFGQDALAAAAAGARTILDAATSGDEAKVFRAAFVQGTAKARGRFSDTLDVLTVLLHQRARASAGHDDRSARGAATAVDAVERAKELASNNGNPELITASLLREISPLLS
jgi:DNA polymerase-3 subunit delta'